MKLKKLYSIKEGEWTKWSDTIAGAMKDFYSVYSLYPNILEANDHTFSQFDFLVNVDPAERKHVASKDDVTGIIRIPGKVENISLNGFDFNDDADIDFAVDNELSDRDFSLIYDDEPEWDEPEIPEDCPETEIDILDKVKVY